MAEYLINASCYACTFYCLNNPYTSKEECHRIEFFLNACMYCIINTSIWILSFYRLINSYTSEVDYTTFEEICPPHLYDRKQAASLFNALLRKYPREVHKYPRELREYPRELCEYPRESYIRILESYI